MDGFTLYVENDRVAVRFVTRRALGRLRSGHTTGGDYSDKVIRIARWETHRAQAAALFHELGHYLYDRSELRADSHEEEDVDLLAWIPGIVFDERNKALLDFLGLERKKNG